MAKSDGGFMPLDKAKAVVDSMPGNAPKTDKKLTMPDPRQPTNKFMSIGDLQKDLHHKND